MLWQSQKNMRFNMKSFKVVCKCSWPINHRPPKLFNCFKAYTREGYVVGVGTGKRGRTWVWQWDMAICELVCLGEAWGKGPGRGSWLWGETLGERRGWQSVALGESGLVAVRRPGFLAGNTGWICPRRLHCWEACQVFPVPCRIWHQTQKPVGEVVYTKTFRAESG